MDSFIFHILTALALVFVIEGLIYALFPDAVRRMMAMAITMPAAKLRHFGLGMAAIGLFCVWLIAQL